MDQHAGVSDEGTRAERSHVEGCGRCRASLAALAREAEKPLPAWAHRQEASRPWTRLTSLTSLYTGPLRMDAPTQLPASWTLDEARGTETLHVTLSHRPLSADSLDISQLLSKSRIALHTLIFRKEALR